MAVVRSGNETIIRYSRGLIAVYYVIVVSAGILSVLSLLAAIGEAVDNQPWKDKFLGVVSWFGGTLALAAMSAQLYSMARALARTFVAMGPEGVRLCLPKSDGDLWKPGTERHVKWEEISDISYEGNTRRRVCRFQAGKYIYTLTANKCPSPKTVAKMLAEKKGVLLK